MGLAIDLAVIVVGVLAITILGSALGVSRARRSLQAPVRLALDAVAIGGVWLGYLLGLVPSIVVDAWVLAYGLSIAAWLALPLIAAVLRSPAGETDSLNEATLVGAHYRPLDDGYPGGTYRVVGAGDRVTLLRVTDHRDRRIHSGELHHVEETALADAFAPETDPDAGIRPIAAVRDALQGLYWTIRGSRW